MTITKLDTKELEAATKELAYNFKSYPGFSSFIPSRLLEGGPENWTAVSLPNTKESDCLTTVANAQVIGPNLFKWRKGGFTDFLDAPSPGELVYMDEPDKAAFALVRIKDENGCFTEPFIYICDVRDSITRVYPLLDEAQDILDELNADRMKKMIYCHFFLDVDLDSRKDGEESQWVGELVKLSHECDCGSPEDLEYQLYSEDGEFVRECMKHLLQGRYLDAEAVEEFLKDSTAE